MDAKHTDFRHGSRQRIGRSLLGGALLALSLGAAAHEPVARCVQVDEQTIRCRGGYGDGEGAPGVQMEVLAHSGETLHAAKLDADSTLIFKRPAERFYVLFDVGPGHQVVIEDDEIGPASGRK